MLITIVGLGNKGEMDISGYPGEDSQPGLPNWINQWGRAEEGRESVDSRKGPGALRVITLGAMPTLAVGML